MQVVIFCHKCGVKNRVDRERAENRQAKCGRCGNQLEPKNVVSEAETQKPLFISDATFEREVLQVLDLPVLVDCWAPWCQPCRMIAGFLDQLAAESKGRYVIAKLNVDDNPRVARQFQVQSIPTLLIFKNGALVDRMVGAQPKQTIAARLAGAA